MNNTQFAPISDLNERQIRLYAWLEQQDQAVSLKDIYYDFGLGLYEDLKYPMWDSTKVEWNNSSTRRCITDDLATLSNSNYVNKIIILKPNNVKIASTKDEAAEYVESQRREILKKLRTLSIQRKRLKNDEQSRITFANEKTILKCSKDKD